MVVVCLYKYDLMPIPYHGCQSWQFPQSFAQIKTFAFDIGFSENLHLPISCHHIIPSGHLKYSSQLFIVILSEDKDHNHQ